MPRAQHTQFNVRSAFARRRAQELAKLTGMTATEIVEDALRAYVPPGPKAKVQGLTRHGPILVLSAGNSKVKLRDANAALDAARERDA